MQASTSSTSIARKRRTPTPEPLPSRNSSSSTLSSVTSRIKWSEERSCVPKLWKSTWRSAQMWMQSLTKWSKKTTKWFESTRWSRSRANRTWFCRSTKRRPFCIGKKSSKNTKKNWSGSTPPSSKSEQITCRPWKLRPRLRERPFSENLPKRKRIGAQSKNISKIWGTTSRWRRWRSGLEFKSKSKLQRN